MGGRRSTVTEDECLKTSGPADVSSIYIMKCTERSEKVDEGLAYVHTMENSCT